MKILKLTMLLSILLFLVLSACTVPIFGSTPATDENESIKTETVLSQPAEETTILISTATAPAPTETTAPTEPSAKDSSGWVAFLGYDGNIWLVERGSGEYKQITGDAAGFDASSGSKAIIYCCSQWSSDGSLLAFIREIGTPVSWGMETQTELWVYDLTTEEHRQVLANTRVNGYTWKPDEHVIAYALPINDGYFINRETQSTELAEGIWAVDIDSGSPFELIKPERGYALSRPQWSPDGHYLGFNEVLSMSGPSDFAYYDLENQQYVAREESVGSYSWSPDGQTLAYDQQFTIQNNGQIWIKDFQANTEQPLSPMYTPGYALYPVFSPTGDQVAYLANLTGEEMGQITFFVVSSSGGEPINLGEFNQLWDFHWSTDGSFLIFNAGLYEQRQVIELSVSDGALRVLANGRYAIPQP